MNTVAISFLLYTLAIAALGIFSSRFARQTHADFLLADRGLGPWVAGLSAAASSESGWVTLGLVGFAYQTGVGAFWVVPMTSLAMAFNWFVLGPRLRQASVDQESLTVVDVIAGKYSKRCAFWIRIVGIAIVLSMLTAYVAAQLNAAGKTFNGTFGWSYGTGVLVGAAIILVYTIVGGFRAISWTDVAQSLFMISAVTLIPALLIYHLGGLDAFWEKLATLEDGERLTDIYAGNSGFALFSFLALWLGIPLANSGQPHGLVRLMSARDNRAIFRGGVICTVWVTALFAGAILLGIAARVYYGDIADPENTLPQIARDGDLIPGVIGGMLLAAILAAICSTADSQLLVSASAVSHDLLERIFGFSPSLKSRKLIERCSLILVAAIATAIAIGEVRSVFTFVLDYGWAGLGAGIGPALMMRLLWKRATGPGIIVGMLVGIITVVVWKQVPLLADSCYNLVPAFFGSLASIAIVSYMTEPTDP